MGPGRFVSATRVKVIVLTADGTGELCPMALVVKDCARANSERHVRANSTKQQRQPTLDRILFAVSPISCTASPSLACLAQALGLVHQ